MLCSGTSQGRDALLRVRNTKPNTDAEHRVPTRLAHLGHIRARL